MFAAYTGISMLSRRIETIVESRDGEALKEIIRGLGDEAVENPVCMNLCRPGAREDVEWIAALYYSCSCKPLYLIAECFEQIEPFARLGGSCRLIVDLKWDELVNHPSCFGIENISFVVNLWGPGEFPPDVDSGLKNLDRLSSLVNQFDLTPERIFLKPGEDPVNLSPDRACLFLEMLKSLKEDCYPEYKTLCSLGFSKEGENPWDDVFVYMTLLAGSGLDGIIFKDSAPFLKAPDHEITRWLASVNNFRQSTGVSNE